MPSDRMSRNDFILLAVFVSMLIAIVLIAYAPVADDKTPSMRFWAVVDSPFFIGVVSTFFAAFAGAWGAQLLAERIASRKALLTEIRGTNAAFALAINIANTYLFTKKQYIRSLVQDYEAQVATRQAHAASASSPFHFTLNLQTIAPPFSPIDELRQMLYEKITPDGKELRLITPLVHSILSFADTTAQRNAWIAEVKAMPENTDEKKKAWYFGSPYAPGHTDERYPNLIYALKQQTDDCIAYSILIGQSLFDYSETLTRRYGGGAPRLSQPSFDTAADLIPNMSLYAAWLEN